MLGEPHLASAPGEPARCELHQVGEALLVSGIVGGIPPTRLTPPLAVFAASSARLMACVSASPATAAASRQPTRKRL